MRILFLSAASSIHTVKWVNALATNGHEVYLVYNKGHEPKTNKIYEQVHLCPLKYGGSLAYYLNARELKNVENTIQPDISNVHYASGYGTLARVAKLKNVLLSVWGSDVYEFPYESRMKKKILKRNVSYAKAIASTSYCMAGQLRNVMGKDELNITVTPFGVDLQLFDPRKYKRNETSTILLGTIKALEDVYGIDDFIRGVDVLLQQLMEKGEKNIADRIKVEIYGSGSQESYLRELIKELELEEKITLKGRIENRYVPQVLKQFDVYCAASKYNESFGVAVVEAMAMEVPVVVTDVDGFKEVVIDNETGFIVPRGNKHKMAEKIETLVMQSDLKIKMGKTGRKRVEELYDWKKNVTTMEELYKQLKG